MGRLQWNTRTGRYETAGGVDNPPNGFAPAGTQYVDAVTGETKLASGAGAPDVVLGGASPTTTAAPESRLSPYRYPRKPSETTQTPSTTVAPNTTVPATGKGKTNTSGKGMGGPTAQQVKAGQYVGSPAQVTSESNVINNAITEALKLGDYKGAMELIAALSASGSGGKSSGPSAAETARANADSYRAAINAANQQQAAGKQLQTAYNTQAQGLFDTQSANIKKYYGDIGAQAQKTIAGAGENFLAQLPQATAYANAQVANLPQAQQGLTEALQTYGATTGKADEQSAQSKAYLDALAKMQASSNQQLQTADTAYMGALRTAGQGANTAAQQALAGNIAQLQAGDMSNVGSAQQALIQKGIEAVLAGQTEAASTKANATAKYGVPKKPKAKK